jgi:hypothetical protein
MNRWRKKYSYLLILTALGEDFVRSIPNKFQFNKPRNYWENIFEITINQGTIISPCSQVTCYKTKQKTIYLLYKYLTSIHENVGYHNAGFELNFFFKQSCGPLK